MTVEIGRRLFSVGEYERMVAAGILVEDDRVELLQGEIVAMSPVGSRHAAVVDRLNRLLAQQVGDTAIVRVQSPVRLDSRSEPQPDLALLRWRDDYYARAHPAPDDVILVIEVADTSAEVDRGRKLPLYAAAGIAEAWLVDLGLDVVDVYSVPGKAGYRLRERFSGDEMLTLAGRLAVQIAVSDILA